jgi:signal transduction histidine kinase
MPVQEELAALDAALGHLYVLAAAYQEEEARLVADRDVRGAVDRVDVGLRGIIAFNAAAAHDAAQRIADVRHRSTWLALGLDVACIAVAIAAALIAARAQRRQEATERAHADLLEVRADELEMFGRRVAHDLVSPLSALSFSLASVKREAERGGSIGEPIGRATACLKRAQRLVDNVFDFARAGTAPRTRGRADVREAIDGVLEEAQGADGAKTVFAVEPFDDVSVACSPGILASVLSNLVSNAVKYMDDVVERRVTIRVSAGDESAHVEIEDTGPGLAPGLEDQAFEPYVRGESTSQPGLGLGLSTVRRFVEAHDGRVGVRRASGRGSIFWFDLPRVGGDAVVAPARASRSA